MFRLHILLMFVCSGGLLASDSKNLGFFDFYADNREQGLPNYITRDFVALSYTLFLERTVSGLEREFLAPGLARFTDDLLQRLGKEPNHSVARTLAAGHLLMLRSLLRGEAPAAEQLSRLNLPKSLGDTLQAELALVQAAQGQQHSLLFGQVLDYSCFKVRGKYSAEADLAAYFQAITYASAPLYFLCESLATGIDSAGADNYTAAALLLSETLAADPELAARRNEIDRLLALFFGPADDLGPTDYAQAREPGEAIRAFRSRILAQLVTQDRLPRIISTPMTLSAGSSEKPQLVAAGWRLFPAARAADSVVFQELVYPRVGLFKGEGKPFSAIMTNGQLVKGLPLAEELMALLGSGFAAQKLAAQGDQNYAGYTLAQGRARAELARFSGLAGDNLRLIATWLDGDDTQRGLTGVSAFWTRLRHANLAYSKQSSTSQAKSLSRDNRRSSAWLDPDPHFYRHLAQLVRTIERARPNSEATSYAELLETLTALATNLKLGMELNPQEVAWLNQLDRNLLPLVGGPDLPVVVDVHTESNSAVVLQEAVGYPEPVFKQLAAGACRGANFSHYQFTRKQEDRLTDEQWREMLSRNAVDK